MGYDVYSRPFKIQMVYTCKLKLKNKINEINGKFRNIANVTYEILF